MSVGDNLSFQSFGLLVIGAAVFAVLHYTKSPWRKLPPGPKGLPLIGNILQLGAKQWLTFSEFQKSFGALWSKFFTIRRD